MIIILHYFIFGGDLVAIFAVDPDSFNTRMTEVIKVLQNMDSSKDIPPPNFN